MLKDMLNCAPALVLGDNPMLVFRAISDSNYGTVYVFGDRRAPYLVWIVFRGTANAKSAGSYTRPSSLTATTFADFFGINDAGLKGIFKILQEMIHCILQMAVDVATELNPGVELAPGSIKLLTTGHSLGGALATAFAGEYVQQISPNLSNVGASIFDINIGCYSLASPRIYGIDEAASFCCLTQAGDLCKTDPAAQKVVKPDSRVKGRISYLRIVTEDDIVPGLPKIGYDHPCSSFKDGRERDEITMDCDIESGKTLFSKGNSFITNKVSTRCLGSKRPSMTANFSKAPVCTDKRRSGVSISSILYHLSYCGIMFAGGVDMTSALSLDVERLQLEDVNAAAVDPRALRINADDTMMRILWYGFNRAPIAKCVFFDLVPFRVKETMAQSAPAAASASSTPSPAAASSTPPAAPSAASSTPPAAPSAASSTPPAAPSPAAASPAAPSPAAAQPTQTDSSVLLEDSKMTKGFLNTLKQAIISDDKYTYPITDASFKPPILYKPPKGTTPPQQYNYLYQLPADISEINITSNYVLFFGKSYNPTVNEDVVTAHEGQELLLPELPSLPPAVAAPAVAAASLATTANAGGKRTRRLHKLKSRKHKKGKKVARVSRRKHPKSHTKRH
jgi:hypothetical protein